MSTPVKPVPDPKAYPPVVPAFHRYTITSEGASLGYFRLVEDPAGAWVTFAEVEAALKPGAAPVVGIAHQLEKEEEASRVDGECDVQRQDLPRKTS